MIKALGKIDHSDSTDHGNSREWWDDPIWVCGRVPNGFWDTRKNRVAYMRWLGERLGFQKADDWYALIRRHFIQNRGSGLLNGAYGDSPLAALQDFMPRKRWLPWLLRSTPQGFWQDVRNRRYFLDWLEVQLGIEDNEDWYHVTKQDFADHGGAGMLANYYRDSVSIALRALRPRVRWQPWRFDMTPQGFWLTVENRCQYMSWLGKQLGIREPSQWYGVTAQQVRQHHGITPLTMHGGSVHRMVQEYLPQFDWKPWLFACAPNGFWQVAENRLAYLCWLGQQLGYRRPADWYAVEHRHFKETGGTALLDSYYGNSKIRAVRERYPNYHWNPSRFQNAAYRNTRR